MSKLRKRACEMILRADKELARIIRAAMKPEEHNGTRYRRAARGSPDRVS